jgi:hypothetical protein
MTPRIRVAAATLLALMVLAAAPSARADVAGDWTMTYTTKEGVKLESTLTLKMEGDKLNCVASTASPSSCGTISSARGSVALSEVSVSGDDITFAIERIGFGDSIRIEYTGKVSGDTMKLKMKVGAREPLDVTVKRK